MKKIDKKIQTLRKLTSTFPIIEYYSHTQCDMYKIDNPYTQFAKSTLVLGKVSKGFEHSLSIAIKELKHRRKKFYGNT